MSNLQKGVRQPYLGTCVMGKGADPWMELLHHKFKLGVCAKHLSLCTFMLFLNTEYNYQC